ncbi:hypothetical protein As57867_007341, partial [Aphanomyces stellatus]
MVDAAAAASASAAGPEDDAVFDFNAPSYYDLDHSEDFEKGYVNNADGYFNQLDQEFDLYMQSVELEMARVGTHTAGGNNLRGDDDDDAHSNTDSAPDSSNEDTRSRDFSTRSVASASSKKPLTTPVAPTLHSAKRAQAMKHVRKPYVPQDDDTIELTKKFTAMPLPLSLDVAPHIAPNSTKPLTQPVMPKLATLARMGEKKTHHHPPTSPHKDEVMTPRRHPPRSAPTTVTPRSGGGAVRPQSPKLQSVARHAAYVREFEERLRKEEESERQKREFKARAAPSFKKRPSLEESHRPLTEPVPFNLSTSNYHPRKQVCEPEETSPKKDAKKKSTTEPLFRESERRAKAREA